MILYRKQHFFFERNTDSQFHNIQVSYFRGKNMNTSLINGLKKNSIIHSRESLREKKNEKSSVTKLRLTRECHPR